jgi:ADP-heptose:LPS heptosyltransferase
MPKILIIRFSSIGDIVLTTPVIRAIKQQVPGAEVHYCTKWAFRAILEPNPYLDKIHYLQEQLSPLIEALRAEQYDFIVDLHHNLRSQIIKFRLGRASRSFAKLNLEKWLLVNLKIKRLPSVHLVDRYLAAAAPLGIRDDGGGLDYFIPAADEVDLQTLPFPHRQGYVAFAIGAQHYTKRLPPEQIIALCEKINQPIVLLGGKEDIATGDQVCAHFARSQPASTAGTAENLVQGAVLYNACGRYSLHGSASLVRQARMIYTHDTGLMHIAAAFKKEIVSIWGNTVPAFGMFPYRTPFTVVEHPHLKCRPCSKIGYQKCPLGHFKCMRELQFDLLPQLQGKSFI